MTHTAAGGAAAGLRSTLPTGVSASPSSKVEGQRLVYSNRCGRVRLNNVTVQNKGVDWDSQDNVYWQHKVCHQLRHLFAIVSWELIVSRVWHLEQYSFLL